MIRYKGEILDYYSNTLKPIVIKKSLASVENLSDRKGTSSYTFNVPRTAKNEMLFDFITEDGSLGQAFGDAEIPIDLNVYERGTIYVTGFNDDDFECIFIGSDLDLIKELKEKKLFDLLLPTEVIQYRDIDFTFFMGTVNASTSVHYTINNPIITVANCSIDNLAPSFLIKSIIEQIFKNYNFSSNFQNTNYATFGHLSNYRGKHLAYSLLNGATSTPINNSPIFVNLGTVNAIQSGITQSGTNYTITGAKDLFKLKLKVHTDKRIVLSVKIFDSSNALIARSVNTTILIGNNQIEFKTETTIPANSYFNVSISQAENATVTFSEIEVYTDNIAVNDYISLRDYMGELSQFDFLKSYLSHHNLLLLEEKGNVYIDLRDSAITPVGQESPTPLADGLFDITSLIKWEQNIELDYIQTNRVIFNQKVQKNSTMDLTEIQISEQGFGSAVYQLDTFANGVQTIESDLQTCYDLVDNFGNTIIPIGLYTEWNNIFTCRLSFFGTFGDTYNINYTQIGGGTVSVTVFAYANVATRFNLQQQLFENTLKKINNNKIKAVELYDYNGDIMSFRRKYVIRGQRYKLIEYDFDVINKLVKAKLQIA